MNFNNFSNQLEGGDYYGHFSQSSNYHLLDILSSEKNPFLEQKIYDSDDSIILQNMSPQQSKYQETENHVPSTINQSEAQQPALKETENISTQVKKSKFIQKKNDPTRKRNKKPKVQNGKTQEKTKGNKSKYNNMGGFLIGSLAYFLNNRFAYRFIKASYEIQIEDKWVYIQKVKIDSDKPYIQGIRKLKKDIDALPRRDGSKQDLFKLVNDQPKDSDLRKEFKRLIRRELVINMQNEQWLKEHADSRDFKPNNDLDGSKKKERHEAYFTYLNAIKQALIEKGELPKRLNL